MKVKVLERSLITRYEGNYSTLSAFLLSPSPKTADSESMQTRGEGELLRSDSDVLSLVYREEDGVRVSLLREGQKLSVTRGTSELCFECGKKTFFCYRTAYGEIPTEALTESVTLVQKGKNLLLTLVYLAAMGGMVQKNEMRFKITP